MNPPGALRASSAAGTAVDGVLGFVAVLAAVLAVWLPITGNYFYGDDFVHLVEVANLPLAGLVWEPYFGHLYVLPRLAYAALFRAFGPEPPGFFALVLLLHLVNVGLLFRAVRALTESPRVACVAAVWWGTLALHEGTLGWFCVHGQLLVATALLVILGGQARLSEGRRPGIVRLVGWYGMILAGAVSFASGIALALLVPFLVSIASPGPRLPRRAIVMLSTAPLVVLGLYVVAHVRVAGQLGDATLPVTLLDFGKAGPQVAVLMWGHLFLFGAAATLAGPLRVSYPSLVTGLLGGVFLLVVAWRTVGLPGRQPRLVLGLLGLVATVYGMVAMFRAAVFQQTFNLTPAAGAAVPRYHYVTSLALVVIVALLLAALGTRLRPSRAVCRLAVVAMIGYVVVLGVRGAHLIDRHEAARRETTRVLDEARLAAERVGPGMAVTIPNRDFMPLEVRVDHFITSAGVFSLFHASNVVEGRRVFYQDGRAGIRRRFPAGSRVDILLRGPLGGREAPGPAPAPRGD